MSDTQILNALKAIVNSHTQNDSEYYLDKSTCPVGMTPCDERLYDCPTTEMGPQIYTSDGHRCYTSKGFSRTEKDVIEKGVRKLLKNITTAVNLLEKIKAEEAGVVETKDEGAGAEEGEGNKAEEVKKETTTSYLGSWFGSS